MRHAPAPRNRLEPLRLGLESIGSWPARRWGMAALAASGAALVTGVPTGIVKTNFYPRMTPVTWWDYPFWAIAALLVGLTAATYVRTGQPSRSAAPDRAKRTLGATALSVFAVGCPICNKRCSGRSRGRSSQWGCDGEAAAAQVDEGDEGLGAVEAEAAV